MHKRESLGVKSHLCLSEPPALVFQGLTIYVDIVYIRANSVRPLDSRCDPP